MKTLALTLLLCSTAASAQEDPVVLFADTDIGQSDVTFLYDPTTNIASNLNTNYENIDSGLCAPGLPETFTYTAMLSGADLSIGGTVKITGCASEMAWGGNVELFPGELSEGTGGASFITPPPAVPEPPMLLLCAMGMLGLWWRRRAVVDSRGRG
jgi:hypothetical protein